MHLIMSTFYCESAGGKIPHESSDTADCICSARDSKFCCLQMFLQEAYEAYHAEDPGQRVPPIPTVKLTVPGSAKEHSLLCYTDHKFTASESHIDAIMKAVYFGLIKLDSMIPLDSDIRAVQVCR